MVERPTDPTDPSDSSDPSDPTDPSDWPTRRPIGLRLRWTGPRLVTGTLSSPCFLSIRSAIFHHQPCRPRQVDPVRPHPGADRGGRSPAHARAVPGLDGHRAGAGHHHQGPERPRGLEGPHPPPHRHPRTRRLRLRGQPVPGRMRGCRPTGRRLPGDPGPDAGQLLPGHGAQLGDRGGTQQDRPPGGRPRAVRGRDRAGTRSGCLPDPSHLGQDRRGRPRAPRRHRGAHPPAVRRRGRTPASPHLRLGLRPVPRSGQLHPGHAGPAGQDGQAPVHPRRGGTTRSRRSVCEPQPRWPSTSSGPARSAT